MKAKLVSSNRHGHRVVIKFDDKEMARAFTEAWNEEIPSRFRYIEEYRE